MKIVQLGSQEPSPEPSMKITSIPDPESYLQKGLRIGTGLASRAAKTAIDLPGNVAKTVGHLGNLSIAGVNKLTSKLGLPAQEMLATENIPKLSEYTIKPLERALLPPGYTKPREEEKPLHDFVSTATSLLLPLPGAGSFGVKKALGVSGAGELAKWGAKSAGAGPGSAEGVKLGAMLATSLLGKSKLQTYKKDLYEKAEAALPAESQPVSIEKLSPRLAEIEKVFKHGEMTPSKTFMKNRIDAIRAKEINGKISIRNIWELKRNMNEHLSDMTKPYGVEKKLSTLSNGLAEILNDYGTHNKPFGEAFRAAESVHQGLVKASPVNAFLQKHVSGKHIGKITGGMILGYLSPLSTGKIVSSALAAREGVKILERFKNSTEIRKYYAQMVAAAARRNATDANKAARKLDEYITKRYPENRT